jgi:hypothetical protein
MPKPLLTVGWREWLALPDLAIPAIKAKIDTGARTSALHTYFVEEYLENDIPMVRFGMHPIQKREDVEIICRTKIFDKRIVTDSGGHQEERIVIKTPVRIAERSWSVEITLTNRENMYFRMLLGRTAMRGKIVVNPAKSFLVGKVNSEVYK